ncbi:methyl-accepting chemotaxis protein WspA [Mariprofundus ferrinatatus]|uniref:Methyl-accepting chemotaxis protein WspA n=1 Tax=Mariprofundus ferrinatatus TaxID=1921087 RepID=A0A2K8L5W3_9PROT|nr:methyl-accepting chemotaxis protein [Mariprofundus ferrinatatus]ATX82708.1 methyl-accepting chemotaxis protein WspA [Mariprofundus ferrinatatus]
MGILNNLKIREKLLLGFAVIVLLFALSSAFTLIQISEINKVTRDMAERDAPAWDAIMEAKVEVLLGHLWLEEGAMAKTAVEKEKVFAHFEEAQWLGNAILNGGENSEVKVVAIDDPAVRDSVSKFLRGLSAFVTMAEQRYDRLGNGASVAEPDSLFNKRFSALLDDLSKAEDKLATIIAANNKASQDMIEYEIQSILVELIILLIVSISISVFISQRVVARPLRHISEMVQRVADGDLTAATTINSKDELGLLSEAVNTMVSKLSMLVSRVQKSGIQVASSVTEIAASTREQEATATEHAATTSQVAASVNEISATSKQLGQTTEEVTQLALGTAESASDGQEILDKLDATMNHMASASGMIAGKLADLNEKASNIGNMVLTINKVADQTNLLSLNAAIEAEKAGEYGRGFAVVATEIRRLADQTAVATYDIEQMVAEVRSAISAGVMSMDKFSEEIHSSVSEAKNAGLQLEKIIDQAQALAPHIELVNEGLQAQVEGAEQISEAMSALSEAAQQTAEFVRHSNEAIGELNEAARGMQEGAAIFKVKS